MIGFIAWIGASHGRSEADSLHKSLCQIGGTRLTFMRSLVDLSSRENRSAKSLKGKSANDFNRGGLFGHQQAPAIMPGTGTGGDRKIAARAIQRQRIQISVRALEDEHIEISHGHHFSRARTHKRGECLAH